MNFFNQIYKLVNKIPEGKVMTYGQIAKILKTKDARKVGWALHGNKSLSVPCHRVVSKDGELALGYAFGGLKEQKARLLSEGVVFKDNDLVDLERCLYVA